MNIEEMDTSRVMETFQKDIEWFYDNLDLLRAKSFTNKFVAIKDKNVISSGSKIDDVVIDVENKGQDPSFLVIEFVYPEGAVLLL